MSVELVLLVEQVLLVGLLIFLVVPVYASVVIVEVKAFKSLKDVLALDGAPTGFFRVVKGLTGYEQNELSHDLLDGLDTLFRNLGNLRAASVEHHTGIISEMALVILNGVCACEIAALPLLMLIVLMISVRIIAAMVVPVIIACC